MAGAGLMVALAGCGPIRLPVAELTPSATESSGSETSSGEMESDSSSDTEPEPKPVCGDGNRDPDEECDDGDANSNSAACKADCTNSTCGDGFVHEGVEECDDGDANANSAACKDDCTLNTCGDGHVHEGVEDCDDGANNADNAACTSECKNASCGDSFIQDGEECDNGDANADNAVCTSECKNAFCGDGLLHDGVEQCDPGGATPDCYECKFLRTVFISSQAYNGNLGGLHGADQKCQGLAASAGLPGKFQAWLSDKSTSAADRLQLQGFTGDLRLTDKTVVASGWQGLTSGNLLYHLNRDEHGALHDEKNVWTYTNLDGSQKGSGHHCMEWLFGSSQAQGHTGLSSGIDSQWTDSNNSALCNSLLHLYCIQTAP